MEKSSGDKDNKIVLTFSSSAHHFGKPREREMSNAECKGGKIMRKKGKTNFKIRQGLVEEEAM